MVNQKNEIFINTDGIIWVRLVGPQTVEDYIAIKERYSSLGAGQVHPGEGYGFLLMFLNFEVLLLPGLAEQEL